MPFTTRTSLLALAFFAACSVSTIAEAQVAVPRSPNTVRGFFTRFTGGNTAIVVWGNSVEADSVWMGWRVRRTIKGITPTPFELVGQHKSKNTVTSACLATAKPCDLSQ